MLNRLVRKRIQPVLIPALAIFLSVRSVHVRLPPKASAKRDPKSGTGAVPGSVN